MQDSPDIHRAGASHLSSLSLRSLLSLLSSYRRFPRRIVHLSIHAARLHRPKRPRCLQAHLTYLVYRKAFLGFLTHLPLSIITNSTRKKQRRTQSLVTRYARFACAPTPRRGACCVAPASLTPSRPFVSAPLPPPHLPHQPRIPPVIFTFVCLGFPLLVCSSFHLSFLHTISSRLEFAFLFPRQLTRSVHRFVAPAFHVDSYRESSPPKGTRPRPSPHSPSPSRPLLLPIIIFSNHLKFWTAA